MEKLPNYIRKHRKAAGLSQEDVAFLLGCGSGAKVCRHERFTRSPSLLTAFAYEIILNAPVRELFGGMFEHLKRTVASRAVQLSQRLESKGQLPPHKKSALSLLVAKSAENPTP